MRQATFANTYKYEEILNCQERELGGVPRSPSTFVRTFPLIPVLCRAGWTTDHPANYTTTHDSDIHEFSHINI